MKRMKTCPTCGLSALAPGREEDWIEKLYAQTCDTIRGICKMR